MVETGFYFCGDGPFWLSVATSTHTSDFFVVRRMYLKYNRCCVLASRGLSTLRVPTHENWVLRALELNFEPCSPSIGWCVLTNHNSITAQPLHVVLNLNLHREKLPRSSC